MRAFIILTFLAVACADPTGYNYQPVSYSNSGISYAPGASTGVNPANTYSASSNSGPSYTKSSYSTPSYTAPAYIAPSYSAPSNSAPSYSKPSYSAPFYSASSNSAPSYSAPTNSAPSYSTPSYSTPSYSESSHSASSYSSPASSAPSYSVPPYSSPSYSAPPYKNPSYSTPSYTDSSYHAPAELHKEFYTFSAPESEFEEPNAIQNIASSVKQGLRVIFIKNPENKGFEDVALALAQQAAQQQTSIYVLNKQNDIAELVNKFNAVSKNANGKPDVHFVKYRTPEDAVNAQRAIQSEYDTLGGNSQNVNGGIAPVINFASQAHIPTATPQQPQTAYLPSSVFRYRL